MALSFVLNPFQSQDFVTTRKDLKSFSLHLSTSRYSIRLAETSKDLFKVFRLRDEIFFREHRKIKLPWLDFDQYDQRFHHLMVEEKKTGLCVGTYRLRVVTDGSYYSESEFDMQSIDVLPGKKLEVGRACVSPNHRNGMVIRLLWKGILQYAYQAKASYVIGCSSVPTLDPHILFEITKELQQKNLMADTVVAVKAGYRYRDLITPTALDPFAGLEDLAPLLHCYLKLGAKIYGGPAYDYEMRCADFLTVMKLDELSAADKLGYPL